MHSRWFNATVVVLWLATMGWLVTEKVLPPLLVGEPPNYQTIVDAQKKEPPAGWRLMFNDRPVGWALSSTASQPNGLTEIRGRVHFDTLPLEEMTPGWLRTLFRLVERPVDGLKMDARSVLFIDPLGRLVRFESVVKLDPLNEVIRVRGDVEGKQLQLVVRSGDFSFTNEAYLPSNSLLGDALSPQTQLPGLRAGQTWTVPVYSPLRPANNPLEIFRATVEGSEPVYWDDGMVDAWLVVYRSDPGGSVGGNQNARGKLWVRGDGAVLKQQIMLFDSTMTFFRLPDERAVELEKKAGPRWWNVEIEQPKSTKSARSLKLGLHD